MRLDPWLASAALSLVLAGGCGDKELEDDTGDGDGAVDTAADDTGSTGGDDTGSTGLPADLSDCQAEDGDSYEVNSISLAGDELTVSVSYSGGCADHDFALCWPDQSFMESAPVQVGLELFHDGHGDPCEAYPTEERTFDLSPLKAEWQAAYGGGSGEIVIRLGGESVSYTF